MNLFENLQAMHESNKNNIIKVKISGVAPSSEGSPEEEQEYKEFVKNDYDLDIVDYGDINPETGYEVIQGDKEDIERYLMDIYGYTFEDEDVEIMKESNDFKELKTFNISFKKDGVYQANLIKGYSEEQVTEFYSNYKPDAEILGVKLATSDDMKPGKPVIDATKEIVKESELRTMSGTDIFAWQGANDFADGSKPLIAYGDGGTLIVSGSDENDGSALISIYYGPDGDHWAFKSYDSKESALKDGRILVNLIDDEEIDVRQLKRFGFEIVA